MARSGVIYGGSGSLKTTAVKHFSNYIYEKTGRNTLLLSMDGGGWDPCAPEVAAGQIRPYRCSMEIPLPTLRMVSRGYFPENTLETDPSQINMVPVNWEEFGGLAIEGLTSISQAIMRYLSDNGMVVGGEKSLPGIFSQKIHVDGAVKTESFGSSTQGHYGFVQNYIYSFVMNAISLPCEYVLFTALESRTEEDDRTTIFGPQIAGKKATALVPSWVGDCIHSQDYPVERQTKVKDEVTGEVKEISRVETLVKSFFVKHPDPGTGILFPAKPRITPEKYAELLKEYPGGYYVPTVDRGFDRYLQTIDRLTRSQTDSVAEWRRSVDAKRKLNQETSKQEGSKKG
jgi:hypothetical protein